MKLESIKILLIKYINAKTLILLQFPKFLRLRLNGPTQKDFVICSVTVDFRKFYTEDPSTLTKKNITDTQMRLHEKTKTKLNSVGVSPYSGYNQLRDVNFNTIDAYLQCPCFEKFISILYTSKKGLINSVIIFLGYKLSVSLKRLNVIVICDLKFKF